MGLILDSGVLIDAERNARSVSGLLAMLEHERGETDASTVSTRLRTLK
jgi:hypothetical protein